VHDRLNSQIANPETHPAFRGTGADGPAAGWFPLRICAALLLTAAGATAQFWTIRPINHRSKINPWSSQFLLHSLSGLPLGALVLD